MDRVPPAFIRVPSGPDAVSEFRAMMRDVGEEGVHLLAEMSELQNFKTVDDIPVQDLSVSPGVFIRYLRDWAVFYVARLPLFTIVIVHAARYRRDGATDSTLFQAAAREGLARVQSLSGGP